MTHSAARLARTPRPALALLGFLLLIVPATVGGLCLLPSPMAIVTPGPAEAVHALVRIDGRSYEPQGCLYVTAVRLLPNPRLGQYILAQLQPGVQTLPRDQVAPPYLSPEEYRTLSQRLLMESQSIAEVVALRQAGYEVRLGASAVKVVGTVTGTEADERLQPGDIVLAANGESVGAVAELVGIVHGCVTGEPVDLRIQRGQRSLTITVPALRGPLDTEGPVLGLVAVTSGLDYRAPIAIALDAGPLAGGPAGGLMYALGVYNALTTEDITRGHDIAGAGTLRLNGRVGPVGAVALKVRAAEEAGAEYFLAAVQDVPAARAAARRLQVIPVRTFEEALAALRQIDSEPSGPGTVPAGSDTTLARLQLR